MTRPELWYEFTMEYPWAVKIQAEIEQTLTALNSIFSAGNCLFMAGNGGSFADCLHFSGELMKQFETKHSHSPSWLAKIEQSPVRDILTHLEPALPVWVLGANPALQTAFLNDVNKPELYFAQELFQLGKKNDGLIVFSTSGQSKNILVLVELARIMEITTIGITNEDGRPLEKAVDICIHAPIKGKSADIQEYQLPIYHYIARQLEAQFFAVPSISAIEPA